MNMSSYLLGLIQVFGGIILSPILVGVIQQLKAVMQGRRGPGIFQPYRELRRLWGKGLVNVAGTTIIYKLAPVISSSVLVIAICIVPISSRSPNFGFGHDALVLVGLLALGRFSIAASSWDTQNGFGLMGASRDIAISVFAESCLVISLAVVMLSARSSDLRTMISVTAGPERWISPVLPLVLISFTVVAIAEIGRQPVDNPDTHLELTMIHEGPLLEYAGRDLALLQWNMAARHWIFLVLICQVFLPHGSSTLVQLIALPIVILALCVVAAAIETVVVKMRVLEVPRLLSVGTVTAMMALLALKATL